MKDSKRKIMNKIIFTTLQAFARCLHPSFRNVVLAFDSVRLSEVKKVTPLAGYKAPPQNCLILNVKFFNLCRHQFVGTVSYYDSTDIAKVAHAILAYIDDLFHCDLRVSATVSSGTPEMMKIVKELGSESKIDGPILYDFGCQRDIVHIIDPSWLLRELHAFFISQDVFFVAENKILRASYADVTEALNASNVTSAFRTYHFQDPRISTTAAAKVFSYTIGQMLKETGNICGDTSDFCIFFDNIFDSVNAAHEVDFVKKMLRLPCQDTTLHENFWRDAIMVLNSMEGCDEPKEEKALAVKKGKKAEEKILGGKLDEKTRAQLTYLNELSKKFNQAVEPVEKEKKKNKAENKKKDCLKQNVAEYKNPKLTPVINNSDFFDVECVESKSSEEITLLKKVFGTKTDKLTTVKVDDSFSFGLLDIQKSTGKHGEEKIKLTKTVYNKKEIDMQPAIEVVEYVTDGSEEKKFRDKVSYVRKMLRKRARYPEFDLGKFVAQFPASPEKEIVEEALKNLKDLKQQNTSNFDDLTKLRLFELWSKTLRGFLYMSQRLSSRHLPYFDTKLVNCDTIHDNKHLVQLTNGIKEAVRIVEHTNLEPLDHSLGDYAWAHTCNLTFSK